jgi:hypothetical protein
MSNKIKLTAEELSALDYIIADADKQNLTNMAFAPAGITGVVKEIAKALAREGAMEAVRQAVEKVVEKIMGINRALDLNSEKDVELLTNEIVSRLNDFKDPTIEDLKKIREQIEIKK